MMICSDVRKEEWCAYQGGEEGLAGLLTTPPPTSSPSSSLGTDGVTKTDEFLEKFQTAFDPSFSENHVALFATKVRMFSMAGLLCII